MAFGNAGRNSLLGPNLKNVDFAFRKQIPLFQDRQSLQFQVEFFNLLNRPNFDLPDRNFDSGTFAKLNSANRNGTKPPRQIQLALRYSF